ncbi:FAR1-related sequence 5-like protein [Tanacetum coccineum]
MEEDHSINVIEVTKLIDLNKQIVEQENEVESNGNNNVLPEVTDPDTVIEEVTENSDLVAMFWADEVAKCNYKKFEDIVSFDATFNRTIEEKWTQLMKILVAKSTMDDEKISPETTLVSFMMSYESAMERQRNKQGDIYNFKTVEFTAPKFETKLAIERHAARVYTRMIFLLVQLLTPQLHESAGGLPSLKLSLHSCSLPGSMNATQVSFWGGLLHFREVGEQICKFGKPQGAYLHISL